jgi:hypothetical protein
MKSFSTLSACLAIMFVAPSAPQPGFIDFNITYGGNAVSQTLTFNTPARTNFLIRQSTDLVQWRPYFNVFMRVTTAHIPDTVLRPADSRDLNFLKIDESAELPAEMRSRWEARAIKRYRFTEGLRCDLCRAPYAARVTVENGIVTNVENPVDQNGAPYPDADLTGLKSIEELFAKLDRYLNSGDYLLDVLAVRFDPLFSFPAWILLDAETEYHVSNLEILE